MLSEGRWCVLSDVVVVVVARRTFLNVNGLNITFLHIKTLNIIRTARRSFLNVVNNFKINIGRFKLKILIWFYDL